jgi:hypothetical protein
LRSELADTTDGRHDVGEGFASGQVVADPHPAEGGDQHCLPPPGAQRRPTAEQEHAFPERLHDLATQTMSTQRGLLGEYRGHHAAHPNMP